MKTQKIIHLFFIFTALLSGCGNRATTPVATDVPAKPPVPDEVARTLLDFDALTDGFEFDSPVDEYELTHFSSAVTLLDGGYIFVGQVIPTAETHLDMLWLKLTTED